ncbi:signal recognition particle-docking protein FtsY [Candidatus Dependentiae bacterium]
MFSFIKNSLKKIYSGITSQLNTLFGKKTIDEAALKELEVILLSADTGVKTTRSIITQLKEMHAAGQITEGESLKQALNELLLATLSKPSSPKEGNVFVLVGINGSGKTTFAAKLAQQYKSLGKKVLLVAADTFRAAATQQLAQWAEKTNVALEQGTENQDPASVVFQGCDRFEKEQFDILIIDTAGRLHTKSHLMDELAKIKRVIDKKLPSQSINTLLTIDSMLGQNSFEQAKLFKECTQVDGIILTKMDGTGKGGIVFAIADELTIPIWYLTFGEQIEQLKQFDKKEYVTNLLDA